jgi:hypothetical protein
MMLRHCSVLYATRMLNNSHKSPTQPCSVSHAPACTGASAAHPHTRMRRASGHKHSRETQTPRAGLHTQQAATTSLPATSC